MIHLDGNHLEGGGQLVRTALALSAITGQPFEVSDIRKGRKDPGLKAQHLHCIEALKKLCGAECEGAELKSEHIIFTPKKIEPRTVSIDIGTAGSIGLLLQSVMLPAMLVGGKVRLKIKGGTAGKYSMTFDYFKEVIVPQLKRYADIDVKLIRRGYYPKGGGEIDIKVKGRFTMEDRESAPKMSLMRQGKLMMIKGISIASADLEKGQVAERQASAAKQVLNRLNVPVKIESNYADTFSTGSEITLWALFSMHEDELDIENPIVLGSDELGEQGKRAEIVGENAAKRLLSEIEKGACVDSHAADNLIPIIAVFGGEMRTSEITDHTKTNIYVIENFLGKCLEIDGNNRIIRNVN
jgi:RNA 3'-phosphate cyclase